MSGSRREFIREMAIGLGVAGSTASALAASSPALAGESESLLRPDRRQPEPAPLGYDRLPLDWHQKRTRALKEKAAERGVDAILLRSDQNQVYFSGCFRQSGERSTWLLFPLDEKDTAHWYSPAIDRDLIKSWWASSNENYFCYPHARGGFPNRGELARGNRVDLFEWMLEGLKKKGLAEKTLGIDFEPTNAQRASLASILPRAKVVEVEDLCLDMQIRKTKEEIALTQRAYRYFDRIHAFARDYILERGTEATDFEVGQALQAYGIGLLMKDIRYDGRPHTAVGIEVTSHYVRTGVATAYPHPNQFFFAKIPKGNPVYVNTDIRLGGMGGECYRNYLVAPFDPAHEKMWQVVTDSALLLRELARPGAVCSEIAYEVHELQLQSGMRDFIYHRPCHGQGQFYSGHQPPFIALGDDTVLEPGMMFSVEPGLYDSGKGVGVNPSDILLVLDQGSVFLSSVPFSREWAFLTL
jgi:Xaa-Pro aminopeptidase